MTAKIVVILRPKEDADDIAAAVIERGLVPLIESILSIEYLVPKLLILNEATPLIFTSANGVRAFAKLDKHRANPVYTVGRNTADEARQAGFSRVESALGAVDDLVNLFTGPLKTGLITPLYVRGETISQDLRGIFAKNDLKIDEVVIYRSNPTENLSINLLKQADSKTIKAVMVFSAKGGQVFSDLIEQYGRALRMKTVKALCIGEGVVHSLSVLPFQEVVVADKPDRYGMIKLLDRLT